MKANLENLVKALRARFDKTNIDMHVYKNDEEIDNVADVNLYYDDVQIGIMNNDVPTIADVQTIARCFFSNPLQVIHVDHSWGFIDLFVSSGTFNKNVDMENLKMALPSDAKL